MEQLVGKKADISVDYLNTDGLLFRESVEILDQKEIEHELIGKRLAIKVRSSRRVEKWILRFEVAGVRNE
ncbi:MAG: hypothetical protein ACE144_04795 [Thermodesulfobacteriota bacterium]